MTMCQVGENVNNESYGDKNNDHLVLDTDNHYITHAKFCQIFVLYYM